MFDIAKRQHNHLGGVQVMLHIFDGDKPVVVGDARVAIGQTLYLPCVFRRFADTRNHQPRLRVVELAKGGNQVFQTLVRFDHSQKQVHERVFIHAQMLAAFGKTGIVRVEIVERNILNHPEMIRRDAEKPPGLGNGRWRINADSGTVPEEKTVHPPFNAHLPFGVVAQVVQCVQHRNAPDFCEVQYFKRESEALEQRDRQIAANDETLYPIKTNNIGAVLPHSPPRSEKTPRRCRTNFQSIALQKAHELLLERVYITCIWQEQDFSIHL